MITKLFNILVGVMLLAGLVADPARGASVAGLVSDGNKAYAAEQYEAAVEAYHKALNKEPEQPIVNYNLGAAQYKLEKYDAALDALNKALLTEDPALRNKAYFNLGNTHYQAGLQQENEDIKEAIRHLEESLAYYDRVDDRSEEESMIEDARVNRGIVEQDLQRLKNKLQQQDKQQQQQQNQSSDQSQSQDNQSQNQSSDSGGQQEQDQSSGAGQKDDKTKQLEQDDEAEDTMDGEEEDDRTQDSRDGDQQDGDARQDQDRGDRPQPQDEEEQGQDERDKESDEDDAPSRSGEDSDRTHHNRQDKSDNRRLDNNGDRTIMSQEQAEVFLRHYQQTEEPDGLLNFNPRFENKTPVFKDW